jgi:hypothetical protein
MGIQVNVDYDCFPKQGTHLGKKVKVCFNESRLINGVVVRDDMDEPFVSIIKLDDNRYVLATECMYSIS